jgi:hypothetical protein
MSQVLAGPKTESREDAGSRRYSDTATPEHDVRRRFASAGAFFAEQQPDSRVSGHAGLTLEERISSVWEGLVATGTADCPVCRGPMERAGHRGHCLRCGSTLS